MIFILRNEMSTSVSKINLILDINGDTKISCELKRHLSPRTVGTIVRSLPLKGNAHLIGKNILYFETTIQSGIERPRDMFKKGEIAFLPNNGSVCFFLEDSEPGKTMTQIGKFSSNVDNLIIKSGDVLSLYQETG